MTKSTILFACGLVALAGSLLIEASGASAEEARISGRAVANSNMAGDVCRVAYSSKTVDLAPPDDSIEDNAAALTVNVRKNCAGAVIAEFQAETRGTIHMLGRATCTATGGFSHPCSVGQIVYSSAYDTGHYYLDDVDADNREGHSVTFIFKSLRRGVWKIEALPGDGGHPGGVVGYRSLVATAFVGG